MCVQRISPVLSWVDMKDQKKDSFSTMTCSSFKGLKGQSCVNRVVFAVGFACFGSFRLFRQVRRFWNRFHEHDTTKIARWSMMKSKEICRLGPATISLLFLYISLWTMQMDIYDWCSSMFLYIYIDHEALLCQICVFLSLRAWLVLRNITQNLYKGNDKSMLLQHLWPFGRG